MLHEWMDGMRAPAPFFFAGHALYGLVLNVQFGNTGEKKITRRQYRRCRALRQRIIRPQKRWANGKRPPKFEIDSSKIISLNRGSSRERAP
jgi:hypothetical protein